MSLTYLCSTIASTQTFTFTFTFYMLPIYYLVYVILFNMRLEIAL